MTLLMPFSTPGIIFFRHGAADDLRLEHIACARLVRLEDDRHLRELARAAGLLLMRIIFSTRLVRRSR